MRNSFVAVATGLLFTAVLILLAGGASELQAQDCGWCVQEPDGQSYDCTTDEESEMKCSGTVMGGIMCADCDEAAALMPTTRATLYALARTSPEARQILRNGLCEFEVPSRNTDVLLRIARQAIRTYLTS